AKARALPKSEPLFRGNMAEEDAVRRELERAAGHPPCAEAMVFEGGNGRERRQAHRLRAIREIECRQDGLRVERTSEREHRLRELDEANVAAAKRGLTAAPAEKATECIEGRARVGFLPGHRERQMLQRHRQPRRTRGEACICRIAP